MTGMQYWKRLSDVLMSYIDHKKSKLEGTKDILERRRLNVSDFRYIGKEASNLERTGILDNLDYIMYQTKETFKKEAVEKGLE